MKRANTKKGNFSVTSLGAAAVLALMTFSSPAGAAGPVHFSADMEVRWDENIGLAGASEDEFDDITTRIAGKMVYDLLVETGREFTIDGQVFYAQVADLSDLSNYGLEIGADYRGEFGSALTAPWYTIGLDYTIAQFSDSEPRDGSWLDLEVVIGKRFNETFNLSGGVRFHQRWQSEDDPFCPQFPNNNNSCTVGTIDWNGDDVFNQERFGYFINAEVNFGARTSAFFEWSYASGDEDATGQSGNFPKCGAGGVAGGANSGCNIFTNDLAFGQFLNAAGNPRFYQVWKAEVVQRVYEIGVIHEFNDQWSGDITFIRMEAPSVKNHEVDMEDYQNTAFMASVGFSF